IVGSLAILFLLLVSILTFVVVRTQVFASSSVNVLTYNDNRSATTSTIYPRVKIVNKGTTTIHLADVKLRYYYTEDGNQPQQFWCDWSNKGASNITSMLIALKSAVSGADHYIELGFKNSAGNLSPGG